jgi:hypothetical protein
MLFVSAHLQHIAFAHRIFAQMPTKAKSRSHNTNKKTRHKNNRQAILT